MLRALCGLHFDRPCSCDWHGSFSVVPKKTGDVHKQALVLDHSTFQVTFVKALDAGS